MEAFVVFLTSLVNLAVAIINLVIVITMKRTKKKDPRSGKRKS